MRLLIVDHIHFNDFSGKKMNSKRFLRINLSSEAANLEYLPVPNIGS